MRFPGRLAVARLGAGFADVDGSDMAQRRGETGVTAATSDRRRRRGAGEPGIQVAPRNVRLGEDRGRPALLVNGVVQSVAPAAAGGGYWEAMLPAHRPRRALLLGVGGGTLAHLLVARFGPMPIVGVDDDPAVVALARSAFGPLPPSLDIVLADAITFVEGCRGRFDYIAVDLFHGAQPPRGVVSAPFLKALEAALLPGGLVVFNLFRDARVERRVGRVGAVLRVVETTNVRDNVLVRCRL